MAEKTSDEFARVAKSTQEVGLSQNEISKLGSWNASNMERLSREIRVFKLESSYEGAQTDLFDFPSALLMHQGWISRVRNYLDGKQSLSASELTDYAECDLGRWLQSADAQVYSDSSEFAALTGSHKFLHEKMREIVEIRDKGDDEGAKEQFLGLKEVSHRVIEGIIALQEITADRLHSQKG